MSTRFNLNHKRVFIDSENGLTLGAKHVLSPEDSHHWKNVLRAKSGQKLEVVCLKKAQAFSAEICNVNEDEVRVKLLEKVESKENTIHQELLVAVPKTKALEFLVEKAVELSVKEIILFRGDHSENKINENKLKRLNKIIESAAKQSKQTFIPKLSFIDKNTNEFLNEKENDYELFICSLNDKVKTLSEIKPDKNKKQLIIVGPEGDFSKSELETFSKYSANYISLGNSVLKVDTACIVSLCSLSLKAKLN